LGNVSGEIIITVINGKKENLNVGKTRGPQLEMRAAGMHREKQGRQTSEKRLFCATELGTVLFLHYLHADYCVSVLNPVSVF